MNTSSHFKSLQFNEFFLSHNIPVFTDTFTVQLLDVLTLPTHAVATHFHHIQDVHSHACVTRVHSVHTVHNNSQQNVFTACSLREQ